MKKAPIPTNDVERLEELYSYAILDSESEQGFDDLVQVAQLVSGMPTILVSLVDKDRQWFKAKIGIETQQLPRDSSFCGHAICQEEPLYVVNALEDDRFHDNPLVTSGPKIRFYAGFPLRSPRGFNLGTLCVIDHKPNQLTAAQQETLSALARQVVAQLEIRKKNKQLTALNRILADRQAEIIEAKKQTALAVMAGGLAHEINNPLAVVLSRLARLERKLDKNFREAFEDVNEDLTSMAQASKRIHAIVKDMLDFDEAYRQELEQPMAVSELIRRVRNLIAARFAEYQITLQVSPFDDFVFLVKRNQIVQALFHLLCNAYDAVVASSEAWVKIDIRRLDEWVEIEVIDSGLGIDQALQERMMEPFFTTKEPGRGSGLGLAVARQYALAHGGSLVYKRQSKHTSFVLTLPVVGDHLQAAS